MAHGFKHGGSGGGSGGLELTVVGGTTRPAKPTQNMIWVNTPNEIASYVFSATQPGAPVAGMVWITVGDSGNIKIPSPVGKDWITVYPLLAKQYVSGKWVDKDAKSYQNGVWKAWVVYIVKDGVVGLDFSGNMRSTTNMTLTNADGYIKVTSLRSTTAGPATSEKYDVSDYKTIEIDVDVKVIGASFAVGLCKVLNASTHDSAESNMIVKTQTTKLGRQTLTVNIETYSGDYHIATLMVGSNEDITLECHVYNMKMY